MSAADLTETYLKDVEFGHVKYPDIAVQLSDVDGNVFNLIGVVRKTIRREVSADAAEEFTKVAMSVGSYDEVIQLIMQTVVVL